MRERALDALALGIELPSFLALLACPSQGIASGPGSALAVLHGVGPGVTLATLVSDHALAIT